MVTRMSTTPAIQPRTFGLSELHFDYSATARTSQSFQVLGYLGCWGYHTPSMAQGFGWYGSPGH